jgi:very-short-patch-repair endonuclease
MTKRRNLEFGEIKKHSRELRLNMTESEKLLWKEIKNRKLAGFKFLRQHPIIYKGDLIRLNYFVADFYCDEKKLVIELDGPIHESYKVYDEYRDFELENLGLKILRIKNEELTDVKKVLKKIESHLLTIH